MTFTRAATVVVLVLTAFGCNRPEVAATQVVASADSHAFASASAGIPPTISAPAPPVAPKQRTQETVTFSTEPYCLKPAAPGAAGAAAVPARRYNPWLADAKVQEQLVVLDEELKPYASSLIGITFEDDPKMAVVVLYPSFAGYEELQTKLAPRVKPLHVALRPGCHSFEQLSDALTMLKGRAWHPKAGTTPTGWYLDAATSAYAVVIDDSAPEVAEALRQKLGDRVVVTLGKPRRLSLGAGGYQP